MKLEKLLKLREILDCGTYSVDLTKCEVVNNNSGEYIGTVKKNGSSKTGLSEKARYVLLKGLETIRVCRDKVIETFDKLRALVGDGEARNLLFELDTHYCSMAAEEEKTMYKQGFLDAIKI